MPELLPIEPAPPMRRDMDIMANRLPSTDALAGTDIMLRLDSGGVLSLSFTADEVRWELERSDGTTWSGDNGYDAVEVRPSLYFVYFVAADGAGAVSVVADRDMGRAVVVQDRFVESDGKTGLRVLVDPARLDGTTGAYEPIAENRELLGKRLFCEYSEEAALEHIYLNSGTLAWQWVKVELPALKREVGVEAASYWKVRDRLYLLVSRGEGAVDLTLLLDLEQGRNVGRLFGETSSGILDRRCGAKIVFLGEFHYPADRQPG
jgi:hypothetical protein